MVHFIRIIAINWVNLNIWCVKYLWKLAKFVTVDLSLVKLCWFGDRIWDTHSSIWCVIIESSIFANTHCSVTRLYFNNSFLLLVTICHFWKSVWHRHWFDELAEKKNAEICPIRRVFIPIVFVRQNNLNNRYIVSSDLSPSGHFKLNT